MMTIVKPHYLPPPPMRPTHPKLNKSPIRNDMVDDDIELNVINKSIAKNNEFAINDKRELKHKLKSEVKQKFIIGDEYMLRTKSKEGSAVFIKKFILKKFVYSVNNCPVKILILKQIDGYVSTMHTINKVDCEMLHIKYEPGLQVWPMNLNWKHIKKKIEK